MLSTKLILFEGLPRSGKTSLAKFLNEKLVQYGKASQCYIEELSPHPVHAPWNDDPAIFALESLETWRKFNQRVGTIEKSA